MLKMLTLTAAIALAAPAVANPVVGQAAPAFKVTDSNGKARSLSEFKGKTVVLEWTNAECPFVKKHYAGNMQALQKSAAKDGVVWLTVNSGAPGKQGQVDGAGANAIVKAKGAAPAAYLLDGSGAVGRAYAAKTTPHMYIVDPAGKLVYQGGIDDKPTADVADIKGAKNYVTAALADMKAKRAVAVSSSKPYGCSVKYAG
ncbi:thioredoxin family protein [Sphingoaurantiacus capsulatus]|uniref:Thioredoxin family protein n=1 Tax=Sphingoaurantiacus capsulatus TaxID=1771310 RepID=A0ABV7XAN4_9SPHN